MYVVKQGTRLALQGNWTVLESAALALATDKGSKKITAIDAADVTAFDMSGARFLVTLQKRCPHAEWVNVSDKMCAMMMLASQHMIKLEHSLQDKHQWPLWQQLLRHLGRKTLSYGAQTREMISFLGEVILSVVQMILGMKRYFRPMAFAGQIWKVGIQAIPIVSLLSFLIGVVLVYQGAIQLQKFGAEIYTVDLLGIAFLREVGILLAAIIVAGRSGSSFAAQIGTMKLNQELSALRVMGLNPMFVLVLPRVLALMLMLPFLGFLADVMGVLGGALMTYLLIDLSFTQFSVQFQQAIALKTFWIGILKAPLFGFLIAMTGCQEGLKVETNAESVGKHTTQAVVKSIFLIIVADALISVALAFLGI